MDISALCAEAGLAFQRGGRDLWGHVYDPDECHFEFQIGEYVLCLRHRTSIGTEGWFWNVSPGEQDCDLTFMCIEEAEVAQALALYLEYERRQSRTAKPPRKQQQQMQLFRK
jgi:hypothetical protein